MVSVTEMKWGQSYVGAEFFWYVIEIKLATI